MAPILAANDYQLLNCNLVDANNRENVLALAKKDSTSRDPMPAQSRGVMNRGAGSAPSASDAVTIRSGSCLGYRQLQAACR